MKSLSRTVKDTPNNKDLTPAPKERIAKYLSVRGVCSRRKAEDLITQGLIRLNGRIVSTPATFVDPNVDEVKVDQNVIAKDSPDKLYILLNKPRCVVTSMSDPEGRSTVKDYLVGIHERVFPIGRLDYLSEGLLLFTNDGDYAQKIMHPQFGVIKTYEVKIFGHITEKLLTQLKAGVQDENGNLLKPKKVRAIEILKNKSWLEFQLEEGKNREIRKICAACGLTIDKLRRVSIGGLTSWGLASGKYLILNKKEAMSALDRKVEAISPKDSVKLKPFKNLEKFRAADAKEFYKFRTENYQSTMKSRANNTVTSNDPKSSLNR